MEKISILSFSWNTQSNRLCESLDEQEVETNRDGYFTTWQYSGHIPDFWIYMKDKITEVGPTIVVISFQEDVSPGSYFHSHLLPKEMKTLGYRGFDRTKQLGIGKTSFNGLFRSDFFLRGLRTSVYVRNAVGHHFQHRFSSKNYTDSVFQNKGASAIYVPLPNDEEKPKTLAIINAHLPFNAGSLVETQQKQDPMIRQNSTFDQNKFFNQMYRHLILEPEAQPDYFIIMGDLNYRYIPYIKWSAKTTGEEIILSVKNDKRWELVLDRDELRNQLIKGNIYSFKEGVNDMGPRFYPTCKMKHEREPESHKISDYSVGKWDQRVPSHPDRILYGSRYGYQTEIECLEYDRFDVGMMILSDHAGVYALHQFT